MQVLTYGECCQLVLEHATNYPIAKGYAAMPDHELAYRAEQLGETLEEAQRVQALYILSNITHWRHPRAKQVRASLKLIGGAR